ncbi:MAG: DUF4198 domain-containing protein [Bacteroidetes bacterium]|nr:DUF4198 domain-containing protein [Bacteroidota bacterium]
MEIQYSTRMKYCCSLIVCLFAIAFSCHAQDYALVPETFYPHKDSEAKVHVLDLNQMVKQYDMGFDASKTEKFVLHSGKRKTDLLGAVKDSVATVKFENDGLNTLEVDRKPVTDDIERDDFLKILDDEGLNQYSEKAKNGSKDSFRERYTWYLKSLLEVDKHNPNDFEKPLGQEYEIVLKDNPYKGNYGDDISAVVLFKGKPLSGATVIFYIKTAGNSVFVQKLSSDKQGMIYFKLTREGLYMLRSLYMQPSKDKNADFNTWMTTFTFAFTSENDTPNTYKEFGFGNVH